MAKVQIKDLENLVLEGGGAKGAAYAGAIKAIEARLAKLYENKIADFPHKPSAILDYGELDSNGNFVPQVKRMAGASAGAITTFALALGFNTKMIEEATEFEFKQFLEHLDTGMYRMVSEDGKSYVGEDKWKSLGRGNQTKPYRFLLEKEMKIPKSPFKAFVRGWVMNTAKNVLVNGLLQFMANCKAFFQTVFNVVGTIFSKKEGTGEDLDIEPDIWGSISFMLKNFLNLMAKDQGTATISNSLTQIAPDKAPPVNSPQFNIFASKVMNEFIDFGFWRLSRKNEMNIGLDAVANLIWDRGMFSGFKVREFFFDMMIYSCLHPTHFQRCYFPDKIAQEKLLAFQKDQQMTMKGGRTKVDWSKLDIGLQLRLLQLPQLTFQEYFEMTGVSLTLCVSNYTTDEPNYFSNYTTPDVPMMEAVGASMSIPPAIKPVYFEAEAFRMSEEERKLYNMNPETLGKKRGQPTEYFNLHQYEIDQIAIKKYIAKRFNLAIDSNTSMSISSFVLPLLQVIRENLATRQFQKTVEVEQYEIPLRFAHLVYHYNACFKGLMLDGGYKNNIPYNVFRNSIFSDDFTQLEIDPLFEKTLAIKLDDTFPKEWIRSIYQAFSIYQEELTAKKYFRQKRRAFFGSILKRKLLGETVLQDPALKKLKPGEEIDETAENQAPFVFNKEEIESLNIDSFEHIASAVIDLMSRMKKRHRNPWNKQKSIFGLVEGYSYGSNQGQIRYLSDHEHIIPLYSYGIGTYDFNIDRVRPLVNLAKKKAEEHLEEYMPLHLITPL